MAAKKVRTRFDRVRVVVPLLNDENHRVKQEFKKEVDINTIVSKMKNGISPPAWMTSKTPRYGDFSNDKTFQDAFDIVQRAEESFAALPLEFRREIDHDPRNLASAPRELFERYGLIKKPVSSDAGNPASDAPVGQRVQGDRDLPGKAPSGANNASPGSVKGASKAPPAAEGEE